MSRSGPPDSALRTLLVGLVTAIAVVDAALLVVSPPSLVESLRLLLAAGALCVPPLFLALGVVRRPIYAVGSVLTLPLAALYAYTGLLLPWTQRSFALGGFGLDLLLEIPVFGEPLAEALFGGPTLSQATLQLAFRYHYTLVVLALVCVAAAVGVVGWRRIDFGRSERRSRG